VALVRVDLVGSSGEYISDSGRVAADHMGVGPECDRRVRVPESVSDDMDGDASHQQQGRVDMSEVMQSGMRQWRLRSACLVRQLVVDLDRLSHELADRVGIDRLTEPSCESRRCRRHQKTLAASRRSAAQGHRLTSDHLAVLRFASTQPGAIREAVERAAIDGETAAALISSPTLGAHDALLACRQAKRPVVMVSNNAPQAIAAYLDRHQLSELITAVFGRPQGQPELMKPHTALIDRALRLLSADPKTCVMVGDSLTAIEVSRRADVHSIGYAKTPERGDELVEAGAEALIDDMANLASAIRLTGS
jgi:phosphoglycolate phosphatase-like HAD superfamily hydrolase